MEKLTKYEYFLFENQFQSIIDDIFRLVESGEWTGDDTYEWNFKKQEEDDSIILKLKKFISKLSKDQVRKYYHKLINKIKSLPDKLRKKLIISYTTAFLSFVSLGFLMAPINTQDSKIEIIDDSLKEEIVKLVRKSVFEEAQTSVKEVESGYSKDRKDRGNWIGKKFIGTNHGISAPILSEYLGKIPSKKDMENLSYETALKIFKKNYWDRHNLNEYIDQSVANIIYDGVVNQGETGMRIVIRKSLNENGVKISDIDNPFNKKWIKKSNILNQLHLFESIKKHREERYKGSRTFKRHGDGWLRRLNSFKYKGEVITDFAKGRISI